MKKPYKYQRPAGTRYVVNVNEWNKVFGDRGRWPFITCHVFVDHSRGTAQIHFYCTWVSKVVVGLLFPVLILTGGFGTAAEVVKECWFDKGHGTFSVDKAFSGSKGWIKLMKLIRYENGFK